MKNFIKYILQKTLGYKRYLYLFARHKIRSLHRDKKEKDFFKFLDCIKEEGTVLDIGANIGIMTVHMAKKFPDSQIHAFEPEPNNLNTLNRVIAKYKLANVHVHSFALGDENTSAEMVLPKQGSVKMQGLSHVVHDEIRDWNKGEKFTAEMRKLDDLKLDKVAGMKLDVENFEFFVLKGGAETIKKHNPVIYAELWGNELREKVFDLLKSFGYTPYFVSKNFQLESVERIPSDKQNFIFLKDSV